MLLHYIGCSLYFKVGYRIDDRWYIAASSSTHAQNYWMSEWKRNIVIECTTVDGDDDDGSMSRIVHITLTLPVIPPENATNQTLCLKD